ncbi:MAG: TIGR02587 family membrane protein [Myxococcales bacterium]|nr:TIGR02587 family membrane protein [Myxococcales bacterium]
MLAPDDDRSPRPAPPVSRSLQEYGRGVAGGLLFSFPMLYTAEVWQAGERLGAERLLLGLGGVFVLLLGYNRYAGLRRDADAFEVAIDSVEELGLGLVVAAVVLVVLGRIDLAMPLSEIAGKVVVGGLAVAIGVSVGTAQLGGGGDDDDDCGMGDEREQNPDFVAQMALALCGAVLVAANIAPTDEIPEIAGTLSPWALLALTAMTVGVGAFVLHFGDFIRASASRGRRDVLIATIASYLASMIAASDLLWFFGRLDDVGPPFALAQVIVLGLPTALGASAGRLLIQPS